MNYKTKCAIGISSGIGLTVGALAAGAVFLYDYMFCYGYKTARGLSISFGAIPSEASVALIGIGTAVAVGLLTFAIIQLYNKRSEKENINTPSADNTDPLKNKNMNDQTKRAIGISAGVGFAVCAVGAVGAGTEFLYDALDRIKLKFPYIYQIGKIDAASIIDRIEGRQLLSCGAMPWEASVALIAIGTAVVAGLLTFSVLQLNNKLREETGIPKAKTYTQYNTL